MATRFTLQSSGTPPVSPAYDAAWNQTGEADRVLLTPQLQLSTPTALTDKTVTVPITTTQNILIRQYVSIPLPAPIIIGGTLNFFTHTFKVSTSATTNNVTCRIFVKRALRDGTPISTLVNGLTAGGTWTTTATTLNTSFNETATQFQRGDRIIWEIGVSAAAPTTAGTATARFGSSAASDFAATAGLTTDLNPWVEWVQGLFAYDSMNDYQSVSAGDGMSVSEKIR